MQPSIVNSALNHREGREILWKVCSEDLSLVPIPSIQQAIEKKRASLP